MKITNQTTDQMDLHDGNGSKIFFGFMFAIVGIAIGYFFTIKQGPSLVIYLFGAAFAAAGLYMALSTPSIDVSINKTNGKISFKKKSLISGSSGEYDIANAHAVELRESTYVIQNNNQPQGFSIQPVMPQQQGISYQTVLVMKDGTELPLENIKSPATNTFSIDGIPVASTLMSGRGKMFALSNQVAQFIGVPFSEVSSNGMPINAPIHGPSEIAN